MSEELKINALPQEGNTRPDYTEELTQLLRSRRSIVELRDEMENYHDSDLADLLEQLSPVDRRRLYRILGLDRTGDVSRIWITPVPLSKNWTPKWQQTFWREWMPTTLWMFWMTWTTINVRNCWN